MKPKNKKKVWMVAIILALIGAVAVWWWFSSQQANVPEFALDVQISKSPIDDIVPAVSGEITLLHNGQPVLEISKDWGWHFAPQIKVSVRPVMNDSGSQLPPDTPKLLTYMSSPQATSKWNYDFEDGSDTMVGEMDFSGGQIEFSYVYGASHLYPMVEFNFDAVVADGLTLSANQTINFGKLAKAITKVPSINRQTRGSFYYDVSFEPSYRKSGIDLDADSFTQLIREITIKVVARNSVTNQVIDNPCQRVRVEFYPIYVVNDFDASFEWIGYPTEQTTIDFRPDENVFARVNPYLAEIFRLRSWYAYNEIPRNTLPLSVRGDIVEIDLINGRGEVVYHPNNHYADIKMLENELPDEFKDELDKVISTAKIDEELSEKITPNVLVVVRPANYGQLKFSVCSDLSPHNLIENPQRDDPMSPGDPGGEFGQYSYRNENEVCYPDRPKLKDKYTFLCKTWQKNDLLTDRIYTVATLPLWSNASTISDKIIEIVSDFTEQVKRFNFWMWFVVSQITQLVIGGLMIMIKRRNELVKKKLYEQHPK